MHNMLLAITGYYTMGLFIATMLGKVTRPRTEELKPECTSHL